MCFLVIFQKPRNKKAENQRIQGKMRKIEIEKLGKKLYRGEGQLTPFKLP